LGNSLLFTSTDSSFFAAFNFLFSYFNF
jgi:hypothetical protein